jgi:hypothetical protein
MIAYIYDWPFEFKITGIFKTSKKKLRWLLPFHTVGGESGGGKLA